MAHCVFLTDSLSFSGGRKLLLERAAYLRSLSGWDVSVLVQEPTGPLEGIVDVEVVRDFSPSSIPECDVVVATTPREVEDAWRAGRGEVVHFCQGFEITDLEQRVAGRVVPPRYSGTGLFAAARLARKRFSWKRKIKRIDSAYRLPTVLVAVSRHLAEELALRYGREVALCENGVDLSVFHPPDDPPGTRDGSQGLRVSPRAEFSVELPIANSSRLVLPIRIAPASSRRSTTWAV
jgi:hypothetical protein